MTVKKVIRYYFLEGRATQLIEGKEYPLSQAAFNHFILDQKGKTMKAIENDAMKYHRKCQDYEG